MLVADGDGTPIGVLVESAQVAEVWLAEPTLATVRVTRPRGRPLVADRRAYRERWWVERTFAWLLSYRRVVVRWDRLVGVSRGFVLFGLAMICLSRLLQ